MIRELTNLISKMWEEEFPLDWMKMIALLVMTKDIGTACGNHRGIILIRVAPEVQTSVFLHRQ